MVPIITLLRAWSGCDIAICNMWKEQNWPNNKAKTVQGHAAIAELMMDHNARVKKVGIGYLLLCLIGSSLIH